MAGWLARQLELDDDATATGTEQPGTEATENGADQPAVADDGGSDGDVETVADATNDDGVGQTVVGFEPPVILPVRVRGRYMGLALYYPALAALGLVDVARSVFGLPRSERFGVRAVTLTLLFMTLLSKPPVESAKHLRRAAFGAVVGSGRAPAVKTLRRKLAELVAQNRAGEFGTRLARRWVDSAMVATGYLYIDGHMQQYTGKRRLEKVWNSQRRMPLPGVHTYHVGDGQGRPLLFLTEQLSTNLAKAMPPIVAAIRDVVGERPFTVVFDRGGYDGKLFAWFGEQQIGFITYQRGNPNLPAEVFRRREARFEGRRVRFQVAEDTAKVGGRGPWRRIVVRTADGHQTPILTNLGADSRVPNPERKRLDREIAARRQELAVLKASLGDVLLDEPKTASRSAHGLKIAQRGAVRRLRTLEHDIAALVAARKPLPTHVTITESATTREVIRLEHKAIVDRIKISAYNAEEWLLDRLVNHYPNRNDVRDLLRSFAELTGEIDTTNHGVIVTLDPPDTPTHQRALQGLIDDLNTIGATYPGTDIPVTYRVAMHHSQATT